MQPIWHGMFAVVLIAVFFSMVGVIAYQLYGPGIHFDVPDYLLPAGWATTTGEAISGDSLSAYTGALFECREGKKLKAEFLDDSVRLALSDGRQLSLPQLSSTNGTSYANTDETFVFWNRGIAASVEEYGVVTYASCLQI